MKGNVFVGSEGPTDVPRIDIGPQEARVIVENNTLVDTRVTISVNYGEPLSFRNNILRATPVWLYYPPGGVVSCNDIWPDSASFTIFNSVVDRENNICADPLFCGEAAGDFRIARESACAEAIAPLGCGQIGALGVGCSQTPVERLSWGKVKHLFR
ncbi:MAG: hypothetical protein FJY88_11845 [Candidatus Eisenbacteria bacterium]|nr:hypothetical protein [Candidatus Eisenbacteria bacterium]